MMDMFSIGVMSFSGCMGTGLALYYLFTRVLKNVPEEHLQHDDPLEPLPDETVEILVDTIARHFANKKQALPLSLLFDVGRPVSYWVSQLMLVTHPFLKFFVNTGNINTISAFLGDRSNVKRLVERMEQLHAEEAQNKGSSALEPKKG